MNYLLVDDNEVTSGIITKILDPRINHIDLAENGEQAIALLQTKTYDVIVTDILMPVMDGFRFTYELRKNPATNHIPLIAISSYYDHEEDIHLSKRMGIDFCLKKPCLKDDLLYALTLCETLEPLRHRSFITDPAIPVKAQLFEQTLLDYAKKLLQIIFARLKIAPVDGEASDQEIILLIQRGITEFGMNMRVSDISSAMSDLNVEVTKYNDTLKNTLSDEP